MNKRKAIAISVGFHLALLAALGVYFVFQTVPKIDEPKTVFIDDDTVIVTRPEKKVEPPKDKIEIRKPERPKQHSDVKPIDLPETPPDQTATIDPVIGDDITTDEPSPNPKALAKPAPDFPDKAKDDGVSGTVQAVITVGQDGRVIDVEIVSATPEGYFEKATIKALKKWRYEAQLVTPASTAPVLRKVRVTIDFDLKDQ